MVEYRAAASPTDKSGRDGALPTVESEKPSCPFLLSYYEYTKKIYLYGVNQ